MKLNVKITGINKLLTLNLCIRKDMCRGGWEKTFTDEELLIKERPYSDYLKYWSTDMRIYELIDNLNKGYLSSTLREICLLNKWDEGLFEEDIKSIDEKMKQNKKILEIKLTTKKGKEMFEKIENPLFL